MKDWKKQQEQKYLIAAGAEGHIIKSPESSIKNNVKDMYLIHYSTYDHDPAIRKLCEKCWQLSLCTFWLELTKNPTEKYFGSA